MSDAPTLPDGRYIARASSPVVSSTHDGLRFIDITIHCETSKGVGCSVHWKGWLTRGARRRTFQALIAMGCTTAGFQDEIGPFIRLGSEPFFVNIVSIQCDDREASGKWRTFVTFKDIKWTRN